MTITDTAINGDRTSNAIKDAISAIRRIPTSINKTLRRLVFVMFPIECVTIYSNTLGEDKYLLVGLQARFNSSSTNSSFE